MATPAKLILASSSIHRKALLERLQLPFTRHPPNIDESIRNGEAASSLVERLARAKALAVAKKYPDALVIGSDEIAAVNGQILTKPEGYEGAVRQLRVMSGNLVEFVTSVCLMNSRTGQQQQDTVTVEVQFRKLTDTEIKRYLDREQPFDCSGSFKSEGAGITLVHRISSDDNTALLGLPLISLQRMLRNEGYNIP